MMFSAMGIYDFSLATFATLTWLNTRRLAVGLNAAPYLGFQANHIDLAPNFAGTLMGTSNAVANVFSIVGPLIIGFIVTDETDPAQWRIIFYIAAAIYFIGNLMFVVFGRTSVQSWNEPKTKNDEST